MISVRRTLSLRFLRNDADNHNRKYIRLYGSNSGMGGLKTFRIFASQLAPQLDAAGEQPHEEQDCKRLGTSKNRLQGQPQM